MSRLLFTLCILLLLQQVAAATVIKIPEDYATIQAGINAAVNGDTVLVADSTYYENIDFKGKAITVTSYFLVDSGYVHIDSTIINGNRPSHPDSGSVVSFVSGEDTTSVIYGFTITGGTGTLCDPTHKVGGGIYCKNSGARIIHNKIISNTLNHNQECLGGGIGSFPRQTLKHVIIEDNLIESNSLYAQNGSLGGGIFLDQGRIIQNKISDNLSSGGASFSGYGGGIACSCDTTIGRTLVTIIGNIITNNQAISTATNHGGNGGGVAVDYCNLLLLENQISYNKVGGIYSYGSGIKIMGMIETCLVKDNTISHNTYVNNGTLCMGGGLFLYKTKEITIQSNRFKNNIAFNLGGGIYDQETSGTVISGNEFIANSTDPNWSAGGGFFCYLSNDVTINANLFKQNSARQCGGLGGQNSILLVTNNLFTQNMADEGGAIGISQDPPIQIVNQIINNTITGNVADTAGGIHLEGGLKLILLNNICWGNNAPFSPEIYVKGGTMEVAYSNIRFGKDSIQVNTGGTLNWLSGNINTDPQFIPDDTLFHLTPSTANLCVNSGTDSLLMGGIMVKCPMDDYDGEEQPFPGTIPDIGADETDVPTSIILTQGTEISQTYILHQNYPNPFNPSTTIEFSLPHANFVSLVIYDIVGEKVSTLLSKHLAGGNYKFEWSALDLASGVYFYRLETPTYMKTRKMLLIK